MDTLVSSWQTGNGGENTHNLEPSGMHDGGIDMFKDEISGMSSTV